MVCNLRVEADVLKVLRDDLWFEDAVAEAFTRGFVIVELLDELGEAPFEKSLARDLRVVFREKTDPFTMKC
jgi:hypothetical protein